MLSTRAWIRAALGMAFGLVLLYFVAKNVDMDEALAAARDARAEWIFIGIALYGIDILLRVERWRRLIRPIMRLSYPAVAEALVVGYAMNNLLPARLGEVFRADFISRRQRLARSSALGSITIERVMDGVVVVGIFVVGLIAVSSVSSQAWNSLAMMAGLAMIGLAGVLLFIVAVIKWHPKLPQRFAWLAARVEILARSISALSIADVAVIFLLSLVIWLAEASAINCMMRAFGIVLSWSGLCVIVGACSLSALLPSAPGYIGSLQVAFVLAFSALGLAEPLGLLSATATQIFLLGSITLVGLLVLFASRFYATGKRFISAPVAVAVTSSCNQRMAR